MTKIRTQDDLVEEFCKRFDLTHDRCGQVGEVKGFVAVGPNVWCPRCRVWFIAKRRGDDR